MSKLRRHSVIRDLVAQGSVGSQEELRRLLARRGHAVTQATLSRDIHELGLVKTPEGYAPAAEGHADPRLPSLERLMREFVFDALAAQNLVVLRTSAGSAQPVAAALDAEQWEELVGTVGGDDTVLIIAPDAKSATRLVTRLRGMIQ